MIRRAGALVAVVLAAGCSTRSAPVAQLPAASSPQPTVRPVPVLPAVPGPLLGGSIARIVAPVTVYDRPGGAAVSALSPRTILNGPQAVLVAGYRTGWVQVRLPVRPNTATGWVPRRQVSISTSPWSIQVERAKHLLLVRNHGQVVATYPVATGAPATPTPAGVFFVTDLIATHDPGGAFGPAALGLSGHSDVIRQFAGADGVLGIHGTSAQWSIGRSVSHGCIRMRNADSLALLNTVPVGTPVVIT